MNLITDTWRGLVRRKLWPVALLLVAALVAVPLTLAKEPEVEPLPANAVAAAADEGLPATYVTAAGEEDVEEDGAEKRRRTLGDVKDPFEPAPLPKAKKKKAKKASTSETKDSDSSSSSEETDSSQSTGGGATSAPTEPVATPTPTATPTPAPANSIRVRFSRIEETSPEEVEATTVQKLDALPDETAPVLAFHGLENGGKVAVFELTGTVTVEGDGDCAPTPENCQYLKLRAGETAFVTVADSGEETDGQYQLDLVKINAKSTASASKLKQSKRAGEAALRAFEVRP